MMNICPKEHADLKSQQIEFLLSEKQKAEAKAALHRGKNMYYEYKYNKQIAMYQDIINQLQK